MAPAAKSVNVRRQNGWRRSQARQRVLAEEDVCALCHLPVDKTLNLGPDGKPDPMRGEVDEIIPVSLGGSPLDRSNLQLAHRKCNQAKSNKLPSQPMVRPLLPVSPGW